MSIFPQLSRVEGSGSPTRQLEQLDRATTGRLHSARPLVCKAPSDWPPVKRIKRLVKLAKHPEKAVKKYLKKLVRKAKRQLKKASVTLFAP